MITLYGMGSPNVRKVAIALEELGLAYDLRHVAVFTGEQFAPDFLALNPLGKVPVLVDDDRAGAAGAPLFESGAILFYLAETYGGRPHAGEGQGEARPALLPAAGPARHEVMSWLMVQMASIGPMLGQLNHFRLLPKGSEPYAEGRYAAQAERLYRLLDDRLATRAWIAGDAWSIADIATFPWALYLEQHGFDPAAHPALIRWRDAIAARPALARAEARMADAFNARTGQSRAAATPADLDRFFGRTDRVPAADFSSVLAR